MILSAPQCSSLRMTAESIHNAAYSIYESVNEKHLNCEFWLSLLTLGMVAEGRRGHRSTVSVPRVIIINRLITITYWERYTIRSEFYTLLDQK